MIRALLIILLIPLVVVAQQAPKAGNPHGPMKLDCTLCHGPDEGISQQVIEKFDHSATGFELEGLHSRVECRDCHQDPRFAFVGTSCADCHADIHQGRLGPVCENCHSPNGWVEKDEQRLAHDQTSFPLVGVHARVDCDACHSDAATGHFTGTPTDCFFCHQETWAATENPDHEAVGFETDCLLCHSYFASSWGSGDFIHPANFPLEGGHRSLDCMDCHTGGFGNVATDCYSCHQEDFEGTDDPDHVSADFPLVCAVCHTTTAWEPAQFEHDLTGFPLDGAHNGLDCLACHETGYTGTPTDCYSCHQSDYDDTNDPDHFSANFPTDCTPCHTTRAWEPSTWDHDTLFPIYSGRHREEWDSCADCHTVQSNFSVFECIFCHEHNLTDTGKDHSEVQDYEYLSVSCFECHPRGVNDD